MTTRRRSLLTALGLSLVAVFGLAIAPAIAQSGSQGSVVVTVDDATGAIIPGATLTLTALRTNDTRTAQSEKNGAYSFVNLPIGDYRLTVAKPGYATKIYDDVLVEASKATDLTTALSVGAATDTVRVTAESTPVLETSSNAIGTVVDMKQIEDLPLNGRDITAFSQLVAGYNGTYNGLPSTDQGSNIDGVIGNSSRMKFTGNIAPAVSPRLEDIEQMTIQTDQLDLNSGFGQASTQVNFVSRRGGNQFHGRAYEDYRNSGLNANSWANDNAGVRKNKLILNDFGVSVGGPILKDKLFFFGTFAMKKQPGSQSANNTVFTSAAQAGNFTYTGTDGNSHTVNVLSLAANGGYTSAVNSQIATQLSAINSATGSGGLTATSDANLQQVNWTSPDAQTYYYPAGRVDYNLSQKARMYLSFLMTKITQPGATAAPFPGSSFNNQLAGNATKNYTASYGFDYIFSPNLINQLKAGFLYDSTLYAYNSAPLYTSQPYVYWQYTAYGGNGVMSGQDYPLSTNTYYPILTLSDSMTWQHKAHTVSYGVSWYHEQDHYWNPPAGFDTYNLGTGTGLSTGDPAANAFTTAGTNPTLPDANSTSQGEAEQLYAVLTGRIGSVTGENAYNLKTKQYSAAGQISEYPLDEVSSAVGIFAEDSWKITKDLTLNYGLRWDFVGAQHDLTGFYHSASPADIYGPTSQANLFNPGQYGGVADPTINVHTNPYAPWKVTPQPAFGFVWNPKPSEGPLKALLGGDQTVIRGGFGLRRFTEPYQYFWDYATDYGSFYYQQFFLNANNTGAAGTFAPGSLALGNTLPAVGISPTAYQDSAPESEFTFQNSTPVEGLDPHLKQPYSESWNLGIQRGLGHNLALEVRYNGNRTIHNWIALNPNEVNVFENGFLSEFKNAQANLAASGGTSFSSSYGNATPLIDAAFGGATASDYTNSQFITYLQNGAVGSFANTLSGVAGTVPYFCNLVGASFSPCATNAGYTGAGAGYATNTFQANPYAAGAQTGELVAAGYTNYNALQVDLRQGNWHGLQYDANYTWSNSLGVASNNSWTGSFNAFTLRDLHKSYGPSLFDLRNVMHVNGTYDLPFGRGRQFLSSSRILDKVVGGWNVGTIVTYQSGEPAQLKGGYATYNDYADGGINLTGITSSQLQKAVGVHEISGQAQADLIDPKFLKSSTGGGVNPTYVSPNTTPGTIGSIIYLHGPRQFYQDISVTKSFPIHDDLKFRLQSSFLNAWNHPVFGDASGAGFISDSSVLDNNFGLGAPTNESSGETPYFGRVIELRANIDF
jgi:hypothetical protein